MASSRVHLRCVLDSFRNHPPPTPVLQLGVLHSAHCPAVGVQERYSSFIGQYNATLWKYWNDYFAGDQAVIDALFELSDLRGPEPDELQKELDGIVEATRLPPKFVKVGTSTRGGLCQ